MAFTLVATAGTSDSEPQIRSRVPRLKGGSEICKLFPRSSRILQDFLRHSKLAALFMVSYGLSCLIDFSGSPAPLFLGKKLHYLNSIPPTVSGDTHTHTKLSLALRACEVQCETEKRFAMFQALSKRFGVNSPIKLVRARNHCSQAGYKHDGINTPCCNAQLLLSNAVIINKSSSHLHIVVHTLFCEELSAVGEVGVMLQHKP